MKKQNLKPIQRNEREITNLISYQNLGDAVATAL
jgi:hypothetical protein